jgi:hypothetical protein
LDDIPQPPRPGSERFTLHDIFMGPEGLRAGWGLLLFVFLWQLLEALLHPLVQSLLPRGPHSAHSMNPARILALEAAGLFSVAASTWVLARIEGRRISDYGLNDSRRLRNFAVGIVCGAILLSSLVLSLQLIQALAFDGRQLFGLIFLEYAAVWLCAFVLVGFFEELLFRGYAQFTVARGVRGMCSRLGVRHPAAVGFWTAALVTSFYFGFVHRTNPGESGVGLLSAGLIGLVFCFSIWRTGSLWWAIGFHAAWDWMESFFYGVGDSGGMIQGHLLATHPVGRPLLSGGTTGPEGSVLVLPVIALAACAVRFTLPRTRACTPSSPYPTHEAAPAADLSLH